LKIRY